MIIYDYRCSDGHAFEAGVASMTASAPLCPRCEAPSRRVPSRVRLGNRASAGPSRDQMPRSWNGVRQGDPETIRHWHTLADKRERLEEKYPELAGDRRPVLAHEGIFHDRPLRVGDDISTAVGEAMAAHSANAAHSNNAAHSTKHATGSTRTHRGEGR